MTSLKAISTLQKKSKGILLLLLIMILSRPSLSSESLRVAVSGENEGYVTLLEDVLSSFSSVGSDRVLSLYEERRVRSLKKEQMKRMTEESRMETWTEAKEEEEKEYTLLDLKIVSPDLSLYSSFLSSSDSDAYSYIRAFYDIDAVFYVKAESDGGIDYISLLFNGEEIHSAWYNSLTAGDEEGILYSLLSSLLLGEGWHLYSIELEPVNAALSIDGKALEKNSLYVILPDGEHTFHISLYGYLEREEKLSLGGAERLSFTLEEAEKRSLLVTTYPYSADLYYNGIKSGSKYLEGVVTPYVITLESPLFDDYSYQERRTYDHITLYQAPLWTESEDFMKEKKSSFYSSLFYTLLSFGGYAASESITNYYSASVGNACRVVFTGAVIVSLVNLVQNAVDYYNTARTGL